MQYNRDNQEKSLFYTGFESFYHVRRDEISKKNNVKIENLGGQNGFSDTLNFPHKAEGKFYKKRYNQSSPVLCRVGFNLLIEIVFPPLKSGRGYKSLHPYYKSGDLLYTRM